MCGHAAMRAIQANRQDCTPDFHPSESCTAEAAAMHALRRCAGLLRTLTAAQAAVHHQAPADRLLLRLL